uniref:Adenylate kinase 2, mitochondrial n=1 Tax=Lygus hesperus TaxID=30085 RepID=A0A0A9YK26_LYGHE
MSKGDELGTKIKNLVNHGELVPNEIMMEVIEEAIKNPACSKGFVLDGFPRTLPQAELLDELLRKQSKHLDGILSFQVDDAELVGRIQGRLIHPGSGRSYHVKTHPPKVPGKDDITGEDLVQRVDDTCEVLQRRLQQYHSTTAPLLQYYEEKNLLHVIDASKSVDKVSDQVLRSIKSI